jgi:transcriptional regulator with XRE-family HTH domain
MGNEIDVRIGAKIRLQRQLAGLSQSRLSADIGVSYQQLQKYEKGADRISASKLELVARSLGVSVSTFFDLETLPPEEVDSLAWEAALLNRAFLKLTDERKKSALLALVTAFAEPDS